MSFRSVTEGVQEELRGKYSATATLSQEPQVLQIEVPVEQTKLRGIDQRKPLVVAL